MYVYIYVCIYIYMYVYIYTYTCLLFLDQRFLAARNSLGNASTAGSLGKFLSCLIPTWNQDTGC